MSLRRDTNANRREIVPPPPAAFTPAQLSDIRAWLAAGRGATVAGGVVSALADQSSNGNSVAAATGEEVAIVNNWRNGKAALQGASGKRLTRATLTAGARPQPTTIYTVEETPASIVSQQMVFDGMTNTDRNAVYYTAAGLPSAFAGAVLSAAALPASTPIIRRTIFNSTSSSILIEPHGGAIITQSGDVNTFALIGLCLLAAFNGTLHYLGKWGEIVVVRNVPSVDDDLLIRRYLRAEYNIYATGITP